MAPTTEVVETAGLFAPVLLKLVIGIKAMRYPFSLSLFL
jgi:hypothetical protein